MRTLVEKTLKWAAAKAIRTHRPTIVAVTGSVGKSSAKDAIATALATKGSLRASPRNLNTEIGLPLAVLGLTRREGARPDLHKRDWSERVTVWGLFRAIRHGLGSKEFPNTLVLEMALQHPGDIAVLCDIAPPTVGVVTAVGESHMEFMGSVDAIEKEKRVVVERLPKDGTAVLNRDDERVWNMRAKTKAKVVSFGFHEEADVRALRDSVSYACAFDRECGTHVKIAANGSTVPFFLADALGAPAVYAALAAAAVGLSRGLNLLEISEALRSFRPPAGRMRHIEGIKRTTLIDDTYNASPRSMTAALDVLAELPLDPGAKRIAVLGDMLELGAASDEGHRAVGAYAASKADVLIFVGERMVDAEKAAKDAGATEERVFHFGDADAARMFVQERMKMGDIVLVKGSRGMRMEKIVKEVMAEPLDADRLLVSHVE